MRAGVFLHYFRRAFSYPLYLAIFTGVPLGFVALSAFASAPGYDGLANAGASVAGIMMVLGFQFFNTGMVSHFLYLDTRPPMRHRLAAAPCGMNVFVFSAVAANIVYALVAGLAVVGASSLIFDMHWGHPAVFGGAMALLCLIGALLSIALFLLIESQAKSDAVHMVIAFGMFILVNIQLNVNIESTAARSILENSSPLAIGFGAVVRSSDFFGGADMGGALRGMAALGGIAAAMAAAVAALARRRAK